MTDLPINYNRPLIMHIDLNSCFAMIEQQANPLIRHKPVAIAAYDTPRGAVIASSYEAKVLPRYWALSWASTYGRPGCCAVMLSS